MKKDVPENATDAPHVLVFQVAAVTPPIDLDGQRILSGLQVIRDAKLGRRPAVLAEADSLSVQPQVHRRSDAIEDQVDLSSLPAGWDRKCPQIRAHRVVVVRNPRRIGRKWICDIEIMRNAIALDLPTPGHGDLVPVARVEIWAHEIRGSVGRFPNPVELPRSVQRLDVRRFLLLRGKGRRPIGERSERGVRTFLIDIEDRRVLPVRHTFGMLVRILVRAPTGEDDDRAHRGH